MTGLKLLSEQFPLVNKIIRVTPLDSLNPLSLLLISKINIPATKYWRSPFTKSSSFKESSLVQRAAVEEDKYQTNSEWWVLGKEKEEPGAGQP